MRMRRRLSPAALRGVRGLTLDGARLDAWPPAVTRGLGVFEPRASRLGCFTSPFLFSTSARLELPAPQQRVGERERERERVDAHRNPVGESVCLSVGVCEGGGKTTPA